jgi:hypothetical protein
MQDAFFVHWISAGIAASRVDLAYSLPLDEEHHSLNYCNHSKRNPGDTTILSLEDPQRQQETDPYVSESFKRSWPAEPMTVNSEDSFQPEE